MVGQCSCWRPLRGMRCIHINQITHIKLGTHQRGFLAIHFVTHYTIHTNYTILYNYIIQLLYNYIHPYYSLDSVQQHTGRLGHARDTIDTHATKLPRLLPYSHVALTNGNALIIIVVETQTEVDHRYGHRALVACENCYKSVDTLTVGVSTAPSMTW
jgi:hypothetical protein